MKFLCNIAGHLRSVKQARFDYDAQRWRSVCKHCGSSMTRDPQGGWSIVEAVAAPDDR